MLKLIIQLYLEGLQLVSYFILCVYFKNTLSNWWKITCLPFVKVSTIWPLHLGLLFN